MRSFDAEMLWRVYVDALDRRPDSELRLDDDWAQLRTPSSRKVSHNKVLRARLTPGEVEAVVDAVVGDHVERGAGLGWMVEQGSSPGHLSASLEAAGVPVQGQMIGMHRAVRERRASAPSGIAVRRAELADARHIGTLATQGWQRSTEFGRAARDWARRHLTDPESNASFWLATCDGVLAGYAVLRALPSGIGYLQGASVLPAFRGRGLYVALTEARLDALARRGVEQVAIWANPETSAPIATRMGFVEVARATYHEREA